MRFMCPHPCGRSSIAARCYISIGHQISRLVNPKASRRHKRHSETHTLPIWISLVYLASSFSTASFLPLLDLACLHLEVTPNMTAAPSDSLDPGTLRYLSKTSLVPPPPGVASNLDDPSQNHRKLLHLNTFLFALTVIFILIRGYVKARIDRKFSIDDCSFCFKLAILYVENVALIRCHSHTIHRLCKCTCANLGFPYYD